MYAQFLIKQYKWVYEVNKGYVDKSGKQDRRYFMLREDYEFLKDYETNFRTAINSNYTRNIPESKLNRMLGIYKKEVNKNYNICIRCSSMVVSFLKDMGKLYFSVREGFENNVIDNKLDETVTNKDNKGRIEEDGGNPKEDKERKGKGNIKKKPKSSSRAKK